MLDPDVSPTPSRRTVVLGGAAVLGAGLVVAGCSTGGTGTRTPAGPGTPLGPVSEVPVGGARIFDAHGVVVTQATEGEFAGFSTICPHQGCEVSSVQAAEVVCPCHGSTFALDGSVTTGPAVSGLEPRAVTVDGDQITLA